MQLHFDDIPTIESAGKLGRRTSDSGVADAYPFAVPGGRGVSALGLTLGLQAARLLHDRVFPGAAQLAALEASDAPSYTTHSDCGPFDYNATCNEACFGFAPHHMDPFYCATCDEQAADPNNNPAWNWHFVGSRGTIQYKDMEPDACAGRDAWKWQVGACGNCQQTALFRCHDGFKKYPDSQSWDPTICQGLISCDNQLTTCP
jgi:hypothetical protein